VVLFEQTSPQKLLFNLANLHGLQTAAIRRQLSAGLLA
jgi:hypothetical protein